MASNTNPNHPFVVWASCFLWLVSMLAILWSLVLFFCVSDILLITGTDVINAIVLLSGIIMLPTNVHILYSIAHGKRIDHKSKVVCCPMWVCIMWIIMINCLGVGCCIYKIFAGKLATMDIVNKTMRYYRSVPKYKHFVDDLQWSLKCCGLNSYKDWFDHDWYDRIRDYEWDPNVLRRHGRKEVAVLTDSVPLSCCKSGSCISNYLQELGTHSINTNGCGNKICRIIMGSMTGHLVMFLSVIVTEVIFLKVIMDPDYSSKSRKRNKMNIRHIMSVNDRFNASTNTLNAEDTDYENEVHLGDVLLMNATQSRLRMDNRVTIEDEDSESAKVTKKWKNDDD